VNAPSAPRSVAAAIRTTTPGRVDHRPLQDGSDSTGWAVAAYASGSSSLLTGRSIGARDCPCPEMHPLQNLSAVLTGPIRFWNR
jgi:hypothetical protein